MNKETKIAAKKLIELAINEDIKGGDVTTDNLISEGLNKKAIMVAKAEGIIAGLPVAEIVFKKLDSNIKWIPKKKEGDKVQAGEIIVEFSGSYRALLTGERTALNFLQRMCGIATISNKYAQEIKDFNTKILDTRKTLPGFRLLDKYAVRTGGASNHRVGLYDMVMIKDNHIQVAGSITNAVNSIRKKISPEIKIEVETTTIEQVEEALHAGADIIMLDNMNIKDIKKAVTLINGKAKIEASGNITLQRLKEIASTGVDFISSGALTHSVKALDISQKIIN